MCLKRTTNKEYLTCSKLQQMRNNTNILSLNLLHTSIYIILCSIDYDTAIGVTTTVLWRRATYLYNCAADSVLIGLRLVSARLGTKTFLDLNARPPSSDSDSHMCVRAINRHGNGLTETRQHWKKKTGSQVKPTNKHKSCNKTFFCLNFTIIYYEWFDKYNCMYHVECIVH